MKILKKLISAVLASTMVIGMSIGAFANNNSAVKTTRTENTLTETTTIRGKDDIYELTKETFNLGQEDEYTISTVVGSKGDVSVLDSRTNYVLDNGKKVYVSVTSHVSLDNSHHGLYRAARSKKPTSIDHDYVNDIDEVQWGYSYSTWSKVSVSEPIRIMGEAAIINTIIGYCLNPAAGVVAGIAVALIDYYTNDSLPDNAFYFRTYYYGKYGQISRFAQVSQAYTEDYEAIPDTCSISSELLS